MKQIHLNKKIHWSVGIIILAYLLLALFWALGRGNKIEASERKVEVKLIEKPIEKIVYKDKENVDSWVDKYVTMYAKTKTEQSRLKYLMHCLLYKESKHGADKNYGDNGKAGGILQFWQGTYVRMRDKMIDLGLTEHTGSRENAEDAIETTVWALENGRGEEWGPIKRGECN